MADRHRLVGFGAALTAAGSFIALWVPNLGSKVGVGATGTNFLVIGLVLSCIFAAPTFSRRGVLMAGAALLLAAGPWGPEHYLRIIFFVYAVFLMAMVARQTRATTNSGANRLFSWLSGLRLKFAPSAASAAAGAVQSQPASSSRYTPPKRRRR